MGERRLAAEPLRVVPGCDQDRGRWVTVGADALLSDASAGGATRGFKIASIPSISDCEVELPRPRERPQRELRERDHVALGAGPVGSGALEQAIHVEGAQLIAQLVSGAAEPDDAADLVERLCPVVARQSLRTLDTRMDSTSPSRVFASPWASPERAVVAPPRSRLLDRTCPCAWVAGGSDGRPRPRRSARGAGAARSPWRRASRCPRHPPGRMAPEAPGATGRAGFPQPTAVVASPSPCQAGARARRGRRPRGRRGACRHLR